MSDDPISFDRIGTVTIQFDDGPVTLGRPTFKQWRHFSRSLQDISDQAQTESRELTAKVEAAKEALDKATGKGKAAAQEAFDAAEAEAVAVLGVPFYERTLPWMQDVVNQLAKGPVHETDDWPAFLAADHTLPAQIVAHWRTVPKASGPTPTN